MDRNYTPDRVMQLQADEIFVFGSNDRGQHHGGAARDAVEHFGAIFGHARGLQGQSYAIVTLGTGVDLTSIDGEVHELYSYAREHPELTFLMTKSAQELLDCLPNRSSRWSMWTRLRMFDCLGLGTGGFRWPNCEGNALEDAIVKIANQVGLSMPPVTTSSNLRSRDYSRH
jgi:hypothetical protein